MGTEKRSKNKKSFDLDTIEDKVKDIVEEIDLPDIDEIEAPDIVKEKLRGIDSTGIEEIEKGLGLEEDTHLKDTYLGEEVDLQEPESQEGEFTSEEEVDKDGSFTLSLEEDLMSVTIDLYPSKGNGQPLTMESVKAKLESMKVVYGINYELLRKLIKKVEKSKNVKKGIIIARGQPPKEGKNGLIEYKFSDREDVLLREKE